MEPTDHQLLTAFRERQCESSFRQLAARHAAMVFATARRITGDPHRAEEVSQAVFLLLAGKAGEISGGQPVAGWLYHATRHRSLDFLRSETRRQNREQIAADMQSHDNAPPPAPLTGELEAALADLQPDERDVLVLRYLEDRQLREVGCELGISEQAAQKRVARALERLRGMFERRGITLSSGALATLLAGEAAAVVPPTLIASATAAAVGVGASAAAAATLTQGLSTTMTLFNLKTAAAIVATAAVTGTTTYLVHERETDQLRADYQTLDETHGRLAADHQEARELIQLRDEQIAKMQKDLAELPRLRGEVDRLNRDLSARGKLEEENRSLRLQIQQLLASDSNHHPPPASGLGRILTKDSLFFAGYTSPENALLSTLWGRLNGRLDAFLGGMTASDRLNNLPNDANPSEFENESREFSRYFSSMQIVARKDLDPDHVEVLSRLIFDRSAGDPPPYIDVPELVVTPIVREDGEWRVLGTTDPTLPQAWERNGRVIRYAR